MATQTFRHFGLGTKLTLIFLVLGLLPLVLMGLKALSAVSASNRSAIKSVEVPVLNGKIEEINKFINEQTADVFQIKICYLSNTSAGNVSFEDLQKRTAIPGIKELQLLLNKILQENAYVQEVSFVNLSGQTIVDPSSGEFARVSRVQDLNLIKLANISSSVRMLPAFQTAKAGKIYYGAVYPTLLGPMMTVAAPVYNSKDEIIMVAMGEISLEPIIKTIASAQIG